MLKQPRWIGFLLVIVGAIFWGIGGTVSQRLFQIDNISVEWLVSVRLIISGIIMILLAYFTKNNKLVFQIWRNKKAVIQLFIFGLLGMLTVQYTYMVSIQLGNAAVATMLQYLAPVFIIIYLAFSKASTLTRRDFIAVSITVIGTFLLLTNGSFQHMSVPSPAVVWGILSGISLAFYTLYAGKLLNKWGSLNVIGWAMIIGGIGMSIIHPPWKFNTTGWTMYTVLFLIFVIGFGTMLAFWFYLESLKYLKPQETSLLGTIEPLAAIITSVAWLKIPFGGCQKIGSALILCMVLYLSVFKEKEEQALSKAKTITDKNV